MGTNGSWAGALVVVFVTGCGAKNDPTSDAATGSSDSTVSESSESAAPGDGTATPTTAASTTATPPTSDSSDGPAPGSDSGSDGTGQGESGTVRFVAFGDTGEGSEAQHMVANAAELVCARQGCDFAMLLGDNFYDVGVTAVDDPQFASKFEEVYDGLDMPFYVILGNHDYGSLASDWDRGQYQIDYGLVNPKWVMPHFWYTFSSESGDTQFFALDTQRMMFDYQTDAQEIGRAHV